MIRIQQGIQREKNVTQKAQKRKNILIIQMNVINLVQRSIFPLGLICLDHDFSPCVRVGRSRIWSSIFPIIILTKVSFYGCVCVCM